MQWLPLPWVFGDEYLYLSKAYHLATGVDTLADASVGHTYPPLYSYLISLAMGSHPVHSYWAVLGLNLAVGLLLYVLALGLFNAVFGWSKTRKGWAFILLLLALLVTHAVVAGFGLVAMSENLYTPLAALVMALVSYLTQSSSLSKRRIWLVVLTLGVTTGLAVLTRTIGGVLVVAVALTLVMVPFSRLVSLKQRLPLVAGFLLVAVMVMATIKWVDALGAINTHVPSAGYEQLATGYRQSLQEFVTGQGRYFAAFKVVGNHFTYLVLATFFFPLYFLIDDGRTGLRSRSLARYPVLLFVVLVALGSLLLSLVHAYTGFASLPIKYSTYFRYVDQPVLMLWLYGLLRLWQVMTTARPVKLHRWSVLVFVGLAGIALLFVPPRDFYIGLNSFGWGWLDVQTGRWWVWLVGGSLVALTLLAHRQQRWGWLLLVLVLLLQVATLPHILAMHRWVAAGSRQLLTPLTDLATQSPVERYYITDQFTQLGLDNHLYFAKYVLMFYTIAFVPVQPIDGAKLAEYQEDGSSFAYFDTPEFFAERGNMFTEVRQVDPQMSVGILIQD